ncbi:MAG: hypothetical protein GEU73_05990 [Chloroflexi bacterium]|nr:hypothetical protein [Chloroflexota bacterium]
MKWDALREGQQKAIEIAIARYRASEPYTALVLPTRYGKSDVMRLVAVTLWQDGFMPCALALSPNVVLAAQLSNAKKWNEAVVRYAIDAPDLRIRTLSHLEVRPNANGELFLSATIQLVQRNIDFFCDWIESVLTLTGRRVIVFVDESHTGSDVNDWGDAVAELVKAGARAMLLTATPERSDGKRIPGFAFETVDEEPVSLTVSRPGLEPHLVRIELYEGTKRTLRLIPDHQTAFRDAWQENALCKVGFIPFDVDLSITEGGETRRGVLLSSLENRREVRRALSKAVRHAIVIREGVDRLVGELRRFRSRRSEAAAIVFCGNDETKEEAGVNEHAHQIKKAIEELAPELRPIIATSADEGKQRLEAFADGVGDVLIVKQMASLGLDIPRLKVGLDLSPVRTQAAYVQRMMRIATPFAGIMHCEWICPDDVVGRALFEKLVRDEGGDARTNDVELTASYEKERDESAPAPIFGIGGIDLTDFLDSQLHQGKKDQWSVVQTLVTAFPDLIENHSLAELAERAALFGIVPAALVTPDQQVQDTSVATQVLREQINDLANQLTANAIQPGFYDQKRYQEIRSEVFVRAYREAGVPRGVKLDQVTDILMLEGIKGSMERMAEEWSSQYRLELP